MPNWDHVLREIQNEKDDPSDSAVDKVRKKYLLQLEDHVHRNIICYYSGFLSKPANLEGMEINDEDKNGFMLCIHKLDKERGLDLFLHTPGGSGAATESLIDYLKQMFGNDIRAFVPQLAMSAGTIIACACKEIYMGKHSSLGPVDPQLNGFAAYAVVGELQRAYDEMTKDNQRAWVWNPILSRYTPGFVEQCHWAIESSKVMVGKFLLDNMFASRADAEKLASSIVERLTKETSSKGHDKHIGYDECLSMGLKVRPLEDSKDKKLQDLVLTVHHCYMFALSNSPAFKIIENHLGRRWIKTQIASPIFIQQPMVVPNQLLGPGGPTN